MMGQLPALQNALFYEFCLEKHIPKDHLLRQVDQFLDFDQARVHLDPFYSHTGRPSVDPELMIRMLLIGYCYGIHNLPTKNESGIDPYLEGLKWRNSNNLQKMNFNRYQRDGITIYK